MSEERFRNIYDQYWNHARHQEVQRLNFTSIYALIVAGTLAYIGSSSFNEKYAPLLFIFLVIYSLLGYLSVYTWAIPFVIFTRKAEAIAICEWNMPEYYSRFKFYNDPQSGQTKIFIGIRISATRIFITFYSLALSMFVGMLLPYLGVFVNICIPILFLTSVLVLIYVECFEREIRMIEKEFLDKVQSCRTPNRKDNP